MKAINTLIVLIAFTALSSNSFAGKSGSTGSRSSSFKPSNSSTRSATTYRPSKTYGSQNISNMATRNKTAQRQSLLAGSSAPPPRVAQIIKQKESKFGTGFVSGAILAYLLSSHDLSASDKQWVQNKLNDMKAKGEPLDDGLIRKPVPTVIFSYAGLKPQFARGESLNISASAASNSQPVAIKCTMDEAEVTNSNDSAHIAWVPMVPAAIILSCEANGHKDKRIIHIV